MAPIALRHKSISRRRMIWVFLPSQSFLEFSHCGPVFHTPFLERVCTFLAQGHCTILGLLAQGKIYLLKFHVSFAYQVNYDIFQEATPT